MVLLTAYFYSDALLERGLPSVACLAGQVNVSPGNLSVLLHVLPGQSSQQHIHNKLIEKARLLLSTTDLSVSEIAYRLGFEPLPSFSKLVKAKTTVTPLAFRRSFN
ncbi:helix-turn-helix transcriptional regulator [Spirosoma koreense]